MNGDNEPISDDDEGFYFESDHLALKGNPDYMKVIQTIAILEAQRIQACKDIDKLVQLKREALDDPHNFVEKLRKGESLDSPGPITIVEIPQINLSKYGVEVPDYPEDVTESNLDADFKNSLAKKSNANKKLWTYEEQKRLEELLIEFPTERVEMQRFAKIAKALGTRSTKQVASRCQKFFKKLHAAGLHVPGRQPKVSKYGANKYRPKNHKPSTFFPEFHVPVRMTEDSSLLGNNYDINSLVHPSNATSATVTRSNSDAEGFVVSEPDTVVPEEELKLAVKKLLMRIKKVKEHDQEYTSYQHFDFTCDSCQESPIKGVRWHCSTCDPTSSIDYCTDCLVGQCLELEANHPLRHIFIGFGIGKANQNLLSKIKMEMNDSDDDDSDEGNDSDANPDKSNSFSYDQDYTVNCNYLDPNFNGGSHK